VPVARDVYTFLGDSGEPSIANGANTGNSGFIVGPQGVVVVDTGASYRHGRAMLDAIARVTDKPVVLAIITHAVQDFLFGNAAFAERGIPLLSHAKSLDLMRSRCGHCLDNLKRLLGEEAMQGTRLVLPQQVISESTPLEVAGLHLQLLHFGWGATPGDLVVFDPGSGVLFAGGLVSVNRVPELRDGKLQGWLHALAELDNIEARWIVPGHGPVAQPSCIAALRRYLLALDAQVAGLYAAGRSLLEAVDEANLNAFSHWALYPAQHRKNVQQRYLELELRDLETQ